MVQDPETQKGFTADWMQRTHPLTWAYFRPFEKLLKERKALKKVYDFSRDPVYSIYSVTKDTLAPYKVIWMDICDTVKAAVVEQAAGEPLPLPEHTVMFVATRTADEAHYLAAVLNSSPVCRVVEGYIVDNHLSTHPIENIRIPKFDKKERIHVELAKSSQAAHAATSAGNGEGVREAEVRIDRLVAEFYG